MSKWDIKKWFKPRAQKHTKKLTNPGMDEVARTLESMLKPAVFGKIGGRRPKSDTLLQSWWGGNFLGASGEVAPKNQRNGNPMQPVLQIRIDELPEVPSELKGIALITVWLDLNDKTPFDGRNGYGFSIREYTMLDSLQPLTHEHGAGGELPVFPIFWKNPVMQPPTWEDIAFSIPTSVTQANDSDWFFESEYQAPSAKLQEFCPVKLGGWPTWIQGAQKIEGGRFIFQIDSTDKGKLYLGDSGSIYFFKTSEEWVIVSDCF